MANVFVSCIDRRIQKANSSLSTNPGDMETLYIPGGIMRILLEEYQPPFIQDLNDIAKIVKDAKDGKWLFYLAVHHDCHFYGRLHTKRINNIIAQYNLPSANPEQTTGSLLNLSYRIFAHIIVPQIKISPSQIIIYPIIQALDVKSGKWINTRFNSIPYWQAQAMPKPKELVKV